MDLNEIMELDSHYYMNTFGARTPVSFAYGKGLQLWDTEGRVYNDFMGGIAVNALGHSHPALVEAICRQAGKLIHCSNLYYIENQAALAKILVDHSCADRVFFSNSGAEANEGAIKLARIYFSRKGLPQRNEIITMKNSFHGRTLAALAATGQEKYHHGFEPLPSGFKHVPLNDLEALKAAIDDHTCAIMLEPVQGESGVYAAETAYMQNVRKLCDDHGILLIFDEVQCGLARTGKLFGYQHYGVEPDIFTLAKALGGGFPIGALCAREAVASAFQPGDHGSTYGGNPLACAAGLAVMNTMLTEDLSGHAAGMGEFFRSRLEALASEYGLIQEIRGKGLMIGVQLSTDRAAEIKQKCFEKGYLIGTVGSRTLRLLPPLIIKEPDIEAMVNTLGAIIKEITR